MYVGYYILFGVKSQAPTFAQAVRMKRMARGVLTPIKRTKDGRTFYCLQYGRNGRHVSRYVPADEAEAYREATENYRMFMDAVNAHVDELTEQTAKAIREEAEKCRRKAAGSKSAQPPLRGSLSSVQVCKGASCQLPAASTSVSVVELVLAVDR